MKKLLLSVTFLITLFFATTAFAHTELSTTNPEDGSELTETIDTVTLTYSGQIEEGSVFEVITGSGEEISVTEFTIEEGVLTGQLEQPLENGMYTVNWNSISEDGHPLNGTFTLAMKSLQKRGMETKQSNLPFNTDLIWYSWISRCQK